MQGMKTTPQILLEQKISDMLLGFYDSLDQSITNTDVQAMCDSLAADIIKEVRH